MSQGHWFEDVETADLLQALGKLKEEAGSAYEKDFERELQALDRKVGELEAAHKADLGDARETIARIAHKLDTRLLELSLTAADIQRRAEEREEARLELERQKVRLERVKLVLGVIMAFVTGLLLPYLAALVGIP